MMRRATLSSPWGPPVNLGPIVNTPAFEECACMSPDGSTLYFDSGRPGGYGGHDIWQVRIIALGSDSDPNNHTGSGAELKGRNSGKDVRCRKH